MTRRLGENRPRNHFCWTFIPALIGLVEGIRILCMSDASFGEAYGVIPD